MCELTYYNGDKLSARDTIIDTINLGGTVLEISLISSNKMILLTEYNKKTKEEINPIHLTTSQARDLICALTQCL